MTAVAETDVARRVVARTGDRFYAQMAYVYLAVAVIGFAPTYWIPLLTGTLDVPPILHLHAVVFYGWLILLVAQTRLAATRQLARHRALGVLGVSIATAMCFVGVAAAVSSIRQADAAGFGDAGRAFSVVPLTGIAFFAALFAIALVNVKRGDVHKRLILIATVSLLNAAVGRLFLLFLAPAALASGGPPPPVFVTVLPGLVTDLLLVPAMLYDRRTLGYVHRVYWIGGAALVASQLLRAPIAATDTWRWITDVVIAIAGQT
jgi:hypothetical protein